MHLGGARFPLEVVQDYNKNHENLIEIIEEDPQFPVPGFAPLAFTDKGFAGNILQRCGFR